MISDLHLQVGEPETAKAWFDYMASVALEADAIFILGDWFEVWVGDDTDDPFVMLCAAVMRQRAQGSKNSKPCDLFVMHGNRDFLMGPSFVESCSATLLTDPTRLDFDATSYLLTHGDALCTSDVPYMRFRELVRDSQWQADFLSKPLAERTSIARKIREQSQLAHEGKSDYADINEDLALEGLRQNDCSVLIHGHTHKPADHLFANDKHCSRYALSDWDATANPKRTQVLRLSAQGVQRLSL